MSNWENPGQHDAGGPHPPQPTAPPRFEGTGNRDGIGGPPPPGYYQQPIYPQQPMFVPGPPPPAAKPGVLSLRPQSVSDILDVAFQTIKANPTGSLGVSFLSGLASLVLGVAMVAAMGGAVLTTARNNDVGAAFFIVAALALPLIAFIDLIAMGALVHVFSQAVLGHRATIGEAFRAGFRRVWAALGMALLLGIALILVWVLIILALAGLAAAHVNVVVIVLLALALFLGIAPFSVRFCFVLHVVVMENAGPTTAIRRAFRLTRGRFWRTMGIVLLAWAVLSTVSSVLQFVVQAMTTGVLGASGGFGSNDAGQSHPSVAAAIGVFLIVGILGVVVGAFTQPFMINVLGALYVDARIRDEGLAGALMAASAPQNPCPGGPPHVGPGQSYNYPYGG